MEDKSSLESFRSSILKLNSNRKHKVTNSYTTYEAYKWIRKNKWLNIGKPLTEHEFYSIVRKINKLLGEALVNGDDVVLPCRMGRLEIRKYDANITIKDGKIKTNLPIDWNETIKLWYEDEDSYKNRTLIKAKEKELYKIFYNKNIANYPNKSFYTFNINKELKLKLKDSIKEGNIEAFIFK